MIDIVRFLWVNEFTYVRKVHTLAESFARGYGRRRKLR